MGNVRGWEDDVENIWGNEKVGRGRKENAEGEDRGRRKEDGMGGGRRKENGMGGGRRKENWREGE